jgi:hypothetical protein
MGSAERNATLLGRECPLLGREAVTKHMGLEVRMGGIHRIIEGCGGACCMRL